VIEGRVGNEDAALKDERFILEREFTELAFLLAFTPDPLSLLP